MRRLTKAGIAGALLVAAATSSASAIEVWQGHVFITGANNACNAGNWRIDRFFNAVYRPAGLTDNGNRTLLALYLDRYSARYSVKGELRGNGGYAATRVTSSGRLADWKGKYRKARVTPRSPKAATKTVKVKVQFTKFGNTGRCKATLKGSLGKRPDL